MERIEALHKPAFCVIGKEGSTAQGTGFVQKLWEDANSHFSEVSALAQRRPDGTPEGFWGLMTDFSRSFLPWEKGFTQGLYLAGVECEKDALPPPGWMKWLVPGFEYLRVSVARDNAFQAGLDALAARGLPLAGAVQDYTDPATGESFMLFPFRRLDE